MSWQRRILLNLMWKFDHYKHRLPVTYSKRGFSLILRRTFKQSFLSYVQKSIKKKDHHIFWPCSTCLRNRPATMVFCCVTDIIMMSDAASCECDNELWVT